MKHLRAYVVMLALVLGVQGIAEAGNILYYVDGNVGADRMALALAGLSGTHTTTVASSPTDFATQIASATYDMGIYSAQFTHGPDYIAAIGALGTFVQGGGLGILNSWFIFEAGDPIPFEASFTGNTNQTSMTVTDPTLAAGLTNPIALANPGYGIFSTGLNALGGGSVAADFANAEGAIIIGNSGRSIVNGFLNDTIGDSAQGVQLYTNEIGLLFDGTTAVPLPSSLALLGAASMGAGYFGWRRRHAR